MKQMFQKRNNWVVTEFFLLNPFEEVGIRELAKLLNLPPASILREIKILLQNQFIQKIKKVYKANVEKREYLALKTAYNVWKLKSTDLVEVLKDEAVPQSIIVFGSFASARDTSKSDVDIAIIDGKDIKTDLTKYENILKRKISLHKIKWDTCSEELKLSIVNGITLYGYLKHA